MNMLGGKACILNIKAAFIHLIVILSVGGSGTSCKHNFDIYYHHIKLLRWFGKQLPFYTSGRGRATIALIWSHVW